MFFKLRTRINRSLTNKLTFLYTASMLAILLFIAAFLYWAMLKALYAGEVQYIVDEIYVLQEMLKTHPDDLTVLTQEVNGVPNALKDASYHYYVRVYDTQGKVQMLTPKMADYLKPSLFPVLDEKNWQKNIISWQAEDGKKYLLLTGPLRFNNQKPNLFAHIALDISYQEQLIKRFIYEFILFLLAALLILLLIGWLIARKGLKPLYKLAETTEQITITNLSARIDAHDCPQELVRLSLAYNRMLTHLEEAFNRLSQCAAELAHELRTPINNLMSGTEITLRQTRPGEDYRQVLESNMEDYRRLAKLIENILFLSRAESPQASIQRVAFKVHEQLHKIVEYFNVLASEKQIQLICKGRAILQADLILFQRAVSNLLANAIAHTASGGKVKLELIDSASEVVLTIKDTGCGIEQEHLPHVFDKFYRIKAAEQSSQGSGLGLALVKSIMELHQGRISLSSELGKGTKVILYFPKNG